MNNAYAFGIVKSGFSCICFHYSGNLGLTDPDFCKKTTIKRFENKQCITSKCSSPHKACPACVEQGEIDKIGLNEITCCQKGKNLCKFHNLYGSSYSRSKRERENQILELAEKSKLERREIITSAASKVTEIKKSTISCPQAGKVISKEDCIKVSRVFENNRKCLNMECGSPWRICPSCIAFGELKEYGNDCFVKITSREENPIGLCNFHLKHGAEITRSEYKKIQKEQKSTIAVDVSVKTESPLPSAVIEKVVVDPMLKIVPDRSLIETKDGQTYIWVDREAIRPNPNQPRKNFNQKDLEDFAVGLKKEGQLVPISVRLLSPGDTHTYEIIGGERRWRACGIAGIKKMKIVIEEVKDEKELHRLSTIENCHRETLCPLDEAYAFKKIKEDYDYSDARIGEMVGKSDTHVYFRLQLLKLHPDVQELLDPFLPRDKGLRVSCALSIAKLPFEEQAQFAREAVENRWKLGKINSLIRKRGLADGKRKRRPDDDYKILETFLRNSMQKIEIFSEMSEEEFAKLFANRDSIQVCNLLAKAEQFIESFTKIVERIKSNCAQ